MNRLRRLGVTIASVILVHSAVAVDGLPADQRMNAIATILMEIPAMLSGVSTLEYESTREISLGAGGEMPDKGYRTGELKWRSWGALYYYEVTPMRRRFDNDTNIVAFNGIYAQQFDANEQVLRLRKADFKSLPGTLADDIVAPFTFLPKEVREDVTFCDPRLALMGDRTRWAELIKECKWVAVGGPEQGAVAVQIPGPEWEGETYYRVHVSSEKRYPMKWEWFNGKNELLTRYSVIVLGEQPTGNGNVFRYPALATKENFDPANGLPQSEPISTVKYAIKNVRVNQSMDDDSFSVEPTIARSIIDLDAGTVIAVPRQ